MLSDGKWFKAVYIVCGYTDMRKGIDSLAAMVDGLIETTPFLPETLFLFCGRSKDKIKGLLWEGDGFLLLYKKLVDGRYQWPRCEEDVRKLTRAEFRDLMEGFEIERRKTIRKVSPERAA